jgi:hypothetical protein
LASYMQTKSSMHQGRASISKLWLVVLGIFILGVVSAILQMHDLRDGVRQVVLRFSLDGEGNVGAWFSCLFLAFCGYLLIQIGAKEKAEGAANARHWTVLGIIFFALSLDEEAAFHEMAIGPLRKLLHINGFLHFAWVLPGIIFVGAVFFYMLKLLRSLPKSYMSRFVTAGLIYVGGALLMETIGGKAESNGLYGTWSYWIPTLLEEGMELSGILLFFFAVRDFHLGVVQSEVESKEAQVPARLMLTQ